MPASTPVNNGIGVHWGVSTTSVTGYGVLVINSTNQGISGDIATAIDSSGYVVSDVVYNQRETATLETWVSGSAASITAAIDAGTVPAPGTKITIVDATNVVLSGSNWIVGDSTISRASTDLARVSISLRRYAKIS